MSEIESGRFEYETDSCNAICPYCGNSYQVECEDYDENGRDEKCDQCGRVFWRRTEFDVSHICMPIENGKAVHFTKEVTP